VDVSDQAHLRQRAIDGDGSAAQVKGSQSSPQVKGFNNIVVAALGSDDVVSSVPEFLDGAIIGSVEHSLILCLCKCLFARVAHIGEMTFHASLYSATPWLDVGAMLHDVSFTGFGDRNDLQQGILAIR
jgi:hypothetical protein